jgi:phenylpyruvate tautomerase PptA (4-oxalocrotonate tautomerase family)
LEISRKYPQLKEVFEMPVAKIHVHAGAFKDSELATIGTAVQAALEEVLSVPPEDYFRMTHVLPKGQVVHTPAFVGCKYSDRFVLLELTFISGRPKEKRLALLAALNRLVVEKAGLRPDDLVVLIYEMPGENISFGQGLAQRAHISG